jgi:flagella basal body P-ring formation protein FlgA
MLFGLLCLALSANAGDQYKSVDRWLVDTYQLDTENYEIEHLTDQVTDLDNAAVLTVLRPLSQKEPLGLFTLLTQIDYPDGRSEQMQVRVRIRKFSDVVIAADKFDRHAAVKQSAFRISRTDVTNLQEQPLTSLEAIAGLRTTRIIRKGTIVTSGMLESIPDVEAGTEVSIVYTAGLCTITARGKALEPGYKGDLVRVKNADSGKIIHAEVIDNASVSVNP